MVKDYSGSLVVENCRNRRRSPKRNALVPPMELFSATKIMWKAVSAMLIVSLVIGISSTVWYGWQVQSALDQIGKSRAMKTSLADENRLMIAQRDLLLTPEHMEAAARKLGLNTPTRNQVRYP